MSEYIEFAQADLQAIVSVLKSHGYDIDAEPALIELVEISNDKHKIAACLVNEVIKLGLARSAMYIYEDDIARPLPKNKVVLVTVEYVDVPETMLGTFIPCADMRDK